MLIRLVERLLAVRQRSFVPAGIVWIALITVPTLARAALTPLLGDAVPFATFYPAVLVGALLLPAATAWFLLIVTGLIAHLIFVPPHFGWGLNKSVIIALLVYYSSCALVVLTGIALRTAVIRLQMAKEREELLNGELLHRVKNVFALLQTVTFQAAKKPDTTPGQMRAEIEGWLVAMSDTVDLLARHEWQSCDLEQLAQAVLSPFAAEGQIRIEGCSCEIAADGAEPLMLCLHELATNAVKYGALSCPTGQVKLSWTRPEPDAPSCSILWQEVNGPPVQPPTRKGFGSRVIRAQRGLLSATIDFGSKGVRCEMAVRTMGCH